MKYVPCVAMMWLFQCNKKCCGPQIRITWSSLLLHKAFGEGRSACGLLLRLTGLHSLAVPPALSLSEAVQY